MLNTKYNLTKLLCKVLPPILAQTVRTYLISIKQGEVLAKDFTRKSFTGSYFFGNTSDFHAFKFSIHGFFDWRNVILTRKIISKLKKGDIIEVGANIGTETISFADIAKKNELKVYAYEPVLSNLDYIKIFKEKNNLDNLIIKDSLVSDYNGVANFKVPTKNDSGSGFISDNDNDQEFKVVKLDDENFGNISVLCIDVEGFEYQVLKGSLNLITIQRPYIIVEVNKNYLQNRSKISLNDFHNFIKELDYTPYYIKALGLELVDINNFKTLPNKNWICIPNSDLQNKKTLDKTIFLNALNPFNN